jgi:alanine dehydrogenase
MIIGVPKEVKDHETRVGLVPSGVLALREAGHTVLVQTTAGEAVRSPTRSTRERARRSCPGRRRLGRRRPGRQGQRAATAEYRFFRPGLMLFTYLHLAPLPDLTDRMLENGVTGVAYETIVKPTDRCRCSRP